MQWFTAVMAHFLCEWKCDWFFHKILQHFFYELYNIEEIGYVLLYFHGFICRVVQKYKYWIVGQKMLMNNWQFKFLYI